MNSFNRLGILTRLDVAIQMAPCSFDVHVKECLGTLMLGSSLVLLHPQGHLDIDYLSTTIQQHNVTFFSVVPSPMAILSNYLIQTNEFSRLQSIRKFGFLGR
jgi:non-ribosomal peptide synthetase component F